MTRVMITFTGTSSYVAPREGSSVINVRIRDDGDNAVFHIRLSRCRDIYSFSTMPELVMSRGIRQIHC